MYRKINQKRRLTSLFTLIAILIALLFDLFIGSSGMSLKDIIVTDVLNLKHLLVHLKAVLLEQILELVP
jgi:hypothetical protein